MSTPGPQLRPVLAAARAVLSAPEILWCIEHNAQAYRPGEPFLPSCLGSSPGDATDKPCSIRSARLVYTEGDPK